MKTLYEHQEKMIKELKDAMKRAIHAEKQNKQTENSKNILVQSPCGSGKTVMFSNIAKSAEEKGGYVIILVHRNSLASQILKELSLCDIDTEKVHVFTYQSLIRKLHQKELPNYSIIITDEAHHSVANSYKKVYERWPESWKIGFTATPYRGEGEPLSSIYSTMVKGPTVKTLIREGFLSEFSIITTDMLGEKKEDLIIGKSGDFTKQSLGKVFKEFDYHSPVETYRLTLSGRKTIVYVSTIDGANSITKLFQEGGFNARFIHSSLSKSKIESTIEDFRNDAFDILVNVDMVGEGFDVPNCEAVMLLRPTNSLALHIQQSMRCMRKDKNKKAIILDMVGNTKRLGSPDKDTEWDYYFYGENLKEQIVKKPNAKNTYSIEAVVKKVKRKGYKTAAIYFICLKAGLIRSRKDLEYIRSVSGYRKNWVNYKAEELGL